MTTITTMTIDNFTVRPMKRSELDLVIDWAAIEGWNPGIYDAECFYQADQCGFFVGELNNELVASISAVAYSKHFAVIGFYIVKPQFRGRGFGMKMWRAAMAYLGTERNISLDGVIAQQKNYQKSGFQITYRHIRYETVGGGLAPDGIVELKTVPFDKLVAYDQELFPAERKQFLQLWINQPNSSALGVVRDGHVVGYGVIRQSYTGFRIGPLNADDEQIAEQLLLALLAFASDAPVFLDVPDANPEAIKLAQRYGMKPVFEVARMYNKEIPNLPINRVFAVTSLEVG
ncbi:GNAT family N-acetyltransferase [Brasilonema bromeliae]|uniref:GNAT family N-acetyltransferase n=2 Tax=Bromeliae group (in: Brasilonema) TaxID=3398495 RepID=A0ABX1P524_9CYAN|nr:GNAT family N-acetyltransferase [Brasilonema bromeliae]NMG18826.1 GNAT family N-acetyltransferase [Brasilonema bromeliae SPC951]